MNLVAMLQRAALDSLADAARDAHQAGDAAGALILANRWRAAIISSGVGCLDDDGAPLRGGVVALSHARREC